MPSKGHVVGNTLSPTLLGLYLGCWWPKTEQGYVWMAGDDNVDDFPR